MMRRKMYQLLMFFFDKRVQVNHLELDLRNYSSTLDMCVCLRTKICAKFKTFATAKVICFLLITFELSLAALLHRSLKHYPFFSNKIVEGNIKNSKANRQILKNDKFKF